MIQRLILSVILMFGLLAPRAAWADPADITAASRGVVRVVLVSFDNGFFGNGEAKLVGHGSGFAVTGNLILTNAHVVAEARGNPDMVIGIVPPEGRKGFAAKIVAISPDKDLALLKLSEPGTLPALALFPAGVPDGSEVHAVGYPGNVDLAGGLKLADLVEPQTPVKSHGFLSGGRSARSVDTLLHTAAIGAGSSGGPLLDPCGRVIGVNSFGTSSDNGTDSAFYFAVSMREAIPFLQSAGVQPARTAMPCQSSAEFRRAESEAMAAEASRQSAKTEADRRKFEDTRRAQLFAVIAEREAALAIAGVLLLAALAAGGAGWVLALHGNRRARGIGGGLAVALAFGGVMVWLLRPPFAVIDERARAAVAPPAGGVPASASASAKPAPADDGTGKMVCVIDPQRSRVTVSETADIPLEFAPGGCVNTRTQYGLTADTWARVLVPRTEETVTVNAYDPATRTFRSDRYLVDLATITRLRTARDKFTAPACGATEDAARALARNDEALRALLPGEPQERLTYRCQVVR